MGDYSHGQGRLWAVAGVCGAIAFFAKTLQKININQISTLRKPKKMSTIRTGAAGVSLVSHCVRGQLKSDWQDVDAENDDAVDGIVLLRHRENFSGRMLFVQVKSGPSFKKESKSLGEDSIGVAIGRGYIEKHRSRWNALPGPVILAYVEDPDSHKSPIYWQDLKSDASYSKVNSDLVVIPKRKTFGSEAKGELRKMAGSVPDSHPLHEIDMRQTRSLLATPGFSLRLAKEFYREWSSSTDRFHPELGEIFVTNAGWRHITRQGRRPDNILNSLLLLEAARKMVSQGADWRQLGSAKIVERTETLDIRDTLSLRAKIVFRQRAAAPVQVILQRVRSVCRKTGSTATKIKFLSVHELQRGNSRYYGEI